VSSCRPPERPFRAATSGWKVHAGSIEQRERHHAPLLHGRRGIDTSRASICGALSAGGRGDDATAEGGGDDSSDGTSGGGGSASGGTVGSFWTAPTSAGRASLLGLGVGLRKRRRLVTAVVGANGRSNVGGRRNHRANGKRRELRDGFLRDLVGRIVHGDVQGLTEPPDAPNEDGDETMTLGELFGHEVEKLARKIDVVK
jgi:hypothetical protein